MSESRDNRGDRSIYYRDRNGQTFLSGSPPEGPFSTNVPSKDIAAPTLLRGVSHVFVDNSGGPPLIYEKGDEIDRGTSGIVFLFSEKKDKDKKKAVVKTQRFVKKSRYEAMLPLARHEAMINTLVYGEGILIESPRPEYVFNLGQDYLVPKENEVLLQVIDDRLECSVSDGTLQLTKPDMFKSGLSKEKDINKIFDIIKKPEINLLQALGPYYTQILDELSYHKMVPGYTLHTLMKLIPGIRLDKYQIKNPVHLLATFIAILDAIDFVHKKNVVHLDVKMFNLLIEESGPAHLVDFNISILTKGRDCRSLTWDLNWKKTITHLAPELEKQVPPHARQDIYSAGNLLDRLLKKSNFAEKDWYGSLFEVNELVIKMKNDVPEKRPTLSQVRSECEMLIKRLKEAQQGHEQKETLKKAEDSKTFNQVLGLLLENLRDPKKFSPVKKSFSLFGLLSPTHSTSLKKAIEGLNGLQSTPEKADWPQLLKIINTLKNALESDKDDYFTSFIELFDNKSTPLTQDDLIALTKGPIKKIQP